MILQTGFRTDIPGFYSTWFANRLRAGFVLVRNPYDPQSVTRYAINPDVVDLIGFCTKNPAPMLPRMELLRPYGQYWFVTITPYGPEIEPHVPPKAQVLQDFITLSKIVGPDCIAWRYDPIFSFRHLHSCATYRGIRADGICTFRLYQDLCDQLYRPLQEGTTEFSAGEKRPAHGARNAGKGFC